MSFTNTPVTRALVVGLVSSSILASLFDLKHYFYILVDIHIWKYRQLWRALSYQLCYANSSEVLFACMTLYSMRVVERMWGSRKYASFLILVAAMTAILPPLVLTVFLRPLTGGLFNYLPAGPTPILFAILAQYHAIIPHIYRYRVATSPAPPTDEPFVGLTFSDKSYRYVVAVQLALLQWPGSLLGAVIGWLVGYSWRSDLLPGVLTRWRLPGWMVGVTSQKRTAEFEGLRRRLEGENSSAAMASSSGVQTGAGEGGHRRTVGQQILDQFGGAL